MNRSRTGQFEVYTFKGISQAGRGSSDLCDRGWKIDPVVCKRYRELLPEETLDFIEQQNIKFDVVSMDTCRGTLDGDTHMGIRENVELREEASAE